MKPKYIGLLLLGILCGCNDGLEKINDFDQRPFLENLAENIILPAYQLLDEQNRLLLLSVDALNENVTIEKLTDVKIRLKSARLAWQACTPFQFGPAEELGLSAELNIYPIDQFQVEQNISIGSYDLATLNNADTKGYQTIGYLIYGNTDEVLSSLSSARLQYLTDVTERIKGTSEKVYNAWKGDEGNYFAVFTSESSLGVNIGSSVGKLINAINKDFERNTRDGKIGIPVGIRSLGEPIPESVEAYFGGYSVELLEANIKAYEQLYLGGDGPGLDDYLEGIGAATTGNMDLNLKIIEQLTRLKEAIQKISDPLPQAIQDKKSDVEKVFAEMQVLLALFKTDMASSIGVIISYQDNDGD